MGFLSERDCGLTKNGAGSAVALLGIDPGGGGSSWERKNSEAFTIYMSSIQSCYTGAVCFSPLVSLTCVDPSTAGNSVS